MTSPIAMLAVASPAPSGPQPSTSAPDARGGRDGDDASSFSDVMARRRAAQDAAATTPAPAENAGQPSSPATAGGAGAGGAGAADAAVTPDGASAETDGKHGDKADDAAALSAVPTLPQQALAIAAMAAQLQGGPAAGGPSTAIGDQAGAQAQAGPAASTAATMAGATPAAPVAGTAQPGVQAPAAANDANAATAQAGASGLPVAASDAVAAAAREGAPANPTRAPGATHDISAPADTGAQDAARQSGNAIAAAANAPRDGSAGTDGRPDSQAADLTTAAGARLANKDASADANTFAAHRDAVPPSPADMAQALASAWQAPSAPPGADASTTATIRTPVGQAQWGKELGSQLVLMTHQAGEDAHTAQLRLDPPDLGPLQVTIKISDGIAQASFVSAHAAVRQALESALPQLQQTLAQAGISLGQTSVSDQGAQAGFGGMQQGNDRASGQGGSQAGGQQDTAGDLVQIAVPAARASMGLVDTFA
jgi:flagellar hook-length control protein FliK